MNWQPNGTRRPSGCSFLAFLCVCCQTIPGGAQGFHLEYFGALATKWHQEVPSTIILRTLVPPGGPQETHCEHFGDLAAKWPQEPPRRLILSILVPWLTNGPKRSSEAHFMVFWESTLATLARNDNFSHHCTNKHAFCDEFSHFSHHSAAKRSLPIPFRTEMDPILTQNCPKHAQQPRSPVFYERFWLSPAPLCSQTSTLRSKNADVCSETSDSVKSDSTLQPNARLPHFRGPLGVPGGTRRPQSLGKVRWSNK